MASGAAGGSAADGLAAAADPPDLDSKLEQARKLRAAGSLANAIELFASVLELRIAAHGEHHLECAPAYVEYAKALLSKAQAEGDPFASGVCKKEEPAAASSGDATEKVANEDEEGEDEEGEEGEEGEAEADDLELSYQCFEVARLIYEKSPGHELALAEVLECLGEVQMENEMWEDAVSEFERSLEIKKAKLPANDRQLAHLYYQMGTAAVARMENVRHAANTEEEKDTAAPTPEEMAKMEAVHRKQARDAYESAAAVLQLKLEALTNGNGKSAASEEQTEVEELLAEVRAKVLEHAEEAPPRLAAMAPSEGITTIGFGPPEATSADAAATTIGFAQPDDGSLRDRPIAVKNLGVVGGASGKKKAVIQPICTDSEKHCAPTAEAMAPPARKRVRLDVEAPAASTEKIG